MDLAKRAKMLKPSPLQEFFQRARAIKDVISLAVGEMNYCSPQSVKEAGKSAIEHDFTRYTSVSGTLSLRELAAADFQKDGINSANSDNTIISSGAKPLIAAALWALCDPGDEILIPGPYYPPFWDLVLNYGGKPVLVDTGQDGFVLKRDNIERFLSEKTKGIILNSPNNPTGVVWDWDGLRGLSDDIWFLVDEAYHRIVYDENYVSFASFPEISERTITIRSCSKTYAMTGWRIGYLTGPDKI